MPCGILINQDTILFSKVRILIPWSRLNWQWRRECNERWRTLWFLAGLLNFGLKVVTKDKAITYVALQGNNFILFPHNFGY